MRTLARADRSRQQALATVERERSDVRTFEWWRRPEDAVPAITWRYSGQIIAEESIGTGAGQFRHQYTIVVHARDREDMIALADLTGGALRKQGFRAILLAEDISDDEGDYAIGVLAELV